MSMDGDAVREVLQNAAPVKVEDAADGTVYLHRDGESWKAKTVFKEPRPLALQVPDYAAFVATGKTLLDPECCIDPMCFVGPSKVQLMLRPARPETHRVSLVLVPSVAMEGLTGLLSWRGLAEFRTELVTRLADCIDPALGLRLAGVKLKRGETAQAQVNELGLVTASGVQRSLSISSSGEKDVEIPVDWEFQGTVYLGVPFEGAVPLKLQLRADGSAIEAKFIAGDMLPSQATVQQAMADDLAKQWAGLDVEIVRGTRV